MLKEGQECCYDDNGNLTIAQINGGSVNKYAPKDYSSSVDHIREDILPYIYCCKAGKFSRCDKYYQRRPSDNGARYQPPPPGTIVVCVCAYRVPTKDSCDNKTNIIKSVV